MTIPESQLDTWSRQGSVTQSKNTYASVKSALEDRKALYADKLFAVFLQGSYGNDTNIYAESDVDTVIRLDSIMRSDLSSLPADQQDAYHRAHGSATYTFDEFKKAVVTRLSNAFGSQAITPGNKAIHIAPSGSRRSADVVVCYQYRRYIRFISEDDSEYVPGIIFPTASSGEIINYPKPHSDNLTAKHQATSGWLKPMIRIVKNMRSRLVDDHKISQGTALSYYIEGLLYNVPNDQFGGDYQTTVYNCLNWLHATDRSKLLCANRQYWLFGNTNVQWTGYQCTQFLDALVDLWNNW
jgi:hypothetical protein